MRAVCVIRAPRAACSNPQRAAQRTSLSPSARSASRALCAHTSCECHLRYKSQTGGRREYKSDERDRRRRADDQLDDERSHRERDDDLERGTQYGAGDYYAPDGHADGREYDGSQRSDRAQRVNMRAKERGTDKWGAPVDDDDAY